MLTITRQVLLGCSTPTSPLRPLYIPLTRHPPRKRGSRAVPQVTDSYVGDDSAARG
jgi:hypothetical protein